MRCAISGMSISIATTMFRHAIQPKTKRATVVTTSLRGTRPGPDQATRTTIQSNRLRTPTSEVGVTGAHS